MIVDSKNVLLVTNATTEGEILLIKEAFSQARQQNLKIKLSLVHVISSLPTCYFNIPSMVLLADAYYREATQTLNTVGETLQIDKKDRWCINGKIKTEVFRLASKLQTHFILASSTSIVDLHKPFLFVKKQENIPPIRSINSLVKI